jgi:hypothetical protein
MIFISYTENTATYSHRMEPKHLSPHATCCPITGPLSSHAAAAGQQHMASTAADTAGSLTHTHTHTVLYCTLGLAVSSTGILERIKNLTIPKSFI